TDGLHAAPSAVGQPAILNGAAYTIVGVTPREFFGERVRRPPDFWVPLVWQPQIMARPSYADQPRSYWLSLIGRLAPGATREQAQAAATAALRQFLTNTAGANPSADRQRGTQQTRVELTDGAGGGSGVRLRYDPPPRALLADRAARPARPVAERP